MTQIRETSNFIKILPPKNHRQNRINECSTWHTWSNRTRKFLQNSAKEILALDKSRLIHLKKCLPYDYTFMFGNKFLSFHIRRKFTDIAREIYSLKIGRKVSFFDELFTAGFDGRCLRQLFSFVRDRICSWSKDDFSALFTPLGSTGKNETDFLLHSDLYKPVFLLNVFDDVPIDSSGKSTFMTFSDIKKILRNTKSVSRDAKSEINKHFTSKISEDGYERVYDLLHGEHPWTNAIEKAMRSKQFEIKLRKGQGYLIHDRKWLHGRSAPTGGVSV